MIERAFARLKGKWRRLKYVDVTNLSYAPYIIIAACCFHNFTIDVNYGEIFEAPDECNDDEENVIFDEEDDGDDDEEAIRKREELTAFYYVYENEDD